MKRRTLLKSAAAFGATPLFALGAEATPTAGGNRSSDNPDQKDNSIRRFGDGRDWFFDRRYGMFVHWGLYSIPDWNQPNYPNQGRHHELPPQPNDSPDWDKYMVFLNEQVRELCTNYGEIHGIWWDMNVPVYKDPSVSAMIRKLQPKAVINNRGFDEGDFGTPERDYDNAAAEAKEFDKLVEACQSVGMESWGYKKDEDYYTDSHLISSIDHYLARDANYLLNVGPTGEGIIPAEAASILKRIGIWKKSVDQSFQKVRTDTEILN